ncbi:MAG: hypothetical protein AB9869_04485 [Verrucomicrobiia bacterium]
MHIRSAFRCNLAGVGSAVRQTCRESGAVLLEVVLALALFVVAATILTSGMSSSLDAVDRLRLNAHAADLAVTTLSELQLGLKSVSLNGPEPFEPPLEQWDWEILATPLETDLEDTGRAQRIEVVIRHLETPLVYRLTQVMQVDLGSAPAEQGMDEEGPF